MADQPTQPPTATDEGLAAATVSHGGLRSLVTMLIVVFLVALGLRVAIGLWRTPGTGPASLAFPDEQQYWLMAESVAAGSGLQDELGFQATRMPFYPSLLSLFARFDGGVGWARGLHWLLGALTAPLAALLATRLFDRRVGWFAGLAVACDPFLVFFSSLLLTETPAIASLLIVYLAMTPVILRAPRIPLLHWLLIGAAGAFAVQVREASLFLVLAMLALAVLQRPVCGRRWTGAAIAGLTIVLSLLPWAWRNQAVTGEWVWLTTRGGISLYDGVRPGATGASDLGEVKASPEVANLSESAWNQHFLDASWTCMRDDPGRVLRLAVVKLKRTWNPLPNAEEGQSVIIRVISAIWSVPVLALALAGGILLIVRRKAEGAWLVAWLLLPALVQSLLHCVFVGSVRYRLVAMPMIEILAAMALASWIQRSRASLPRGVADPA